MKTIDSGKNPVNDAAPERPPQHTFQPIDSRFPLAEQDCKLCGAGWSSPQHRTA